MDGATLDTWPDAKISAYALIMEEVSDYETKAAELAQQKAAAQSQHR